MRQELPQYFADLQRCLYTTHQTSRIAAGDTTTTLIAAASKKILVGAAGAILNASQLKQDQLEMGAHLKASRDSPRCSCTCLSSVRK